MNNLSKALLFSSAIMSSAPLQAKSGSEVAVDTISARCQSIMNEANALCMDRHKDGKFYITHFQNGVPVKKMMSSPGKVHNDGGTYTPTGIFPIDRKVKKQPTYYGGYLPYASHIGTKIWKDGIYIHQWKVTGDYASHGCLRVAMDSAQYIFNNIPLGTKIAIDNTGRPKK